MIVLLVAACLILFTGGAAAVIVSKYPKASSWTGAGSAVAACLLGVIPGVRGMLGQEAALSMPWSVPYGSFSLGIDPLSGVFLTVIFALGLPCALFGRVYLLQHGHGKSLGPPWLFFNLLLASMALLVTARNGILFLTAWEGMAISSFFLVTLEHERADVRSAGLTYLVMSHAGTAFLLMLFALLGREAGSLEFSDLHLISGISPAAGSGLFFLALVGFGVKAGFVPLHSWLPEAHPAAPSHVSALMSGVMIKMGIYGLLRALMFAGAPAGWWGPALMAVGLSSGIIAVLFAVAQRDLKRLLAYCSVENMGIIALGLGLGFWGVARDQVPIAVLGFAGAFLHVINHAFAKGLLFLGAGSVLMATGERDMDRLGGLIRKLPVAGATFLLGSLAITGLPPLNGFIGEFLLFQGGVRGLGSSRWNDPALFGLLIAGLAFMGGFSVIAFTKAFGTVFLGAPRAVVHQGQMGEAGSRFPLVLLACLCLSLGLAPMFALCLVLPAAAQLSGMSLAQAQAAVAPVYGTLTGIALTGFGVMAVSLALAALRWQLLRRRQVARSVTWDCGYEALATSMQYTATSYARPLVTLFNVVLRSRGSIPPVQGYFPRPESLHTETRDTMLEDIYRPTLRSAEKLRGRLRLLQQGRLHVYLLMVVGTLCVLMLAWQLAPA